MSAERARLLPLQMVFALNAVGLVGLVSAHPGREGGARARRADAGLLPVRRCRRGRCSAFSSSARIIRRFGLRATCVWGGSGFLVSFIGPALAPNAVTLGLALFVCGLTIATIEVSMNAKASQTERVLGRRIMTRCHAFWSFGTVAGGAARRRVRAERRSSFLTQQLILQPIFAAATIFFALRLLADDPEPEAEPERGFSLPPLALLLLCLVPIGALLIEGAMMEWSALLMREDKGASPFVTGGDLRGLRARHGGGPARPATGWPSGSGRGR